MAKRATAFSFIDGQRTVDGKIIRVCDICGRVIATAGRHPACVAKIPVAEDRVRRWALKAMQKEVATKKLQEPPRLLQVLARIAGVNIEQICGEAKARADAERKAEM